MSRLTRSALARPRLTLAVWVAVTILLAVIGLGVEKRLDEGNFVLPGTEAERAQELSARGFGRTEAQAVLLRGPPAQLDRQGPRLVAELRRRDTVLSPWDPGPESRRLRAEPGAALVLVDLKISEAARAKERLAPVRDTLARHVRHPVRAHLSSNSVSGESTTRTALDAAAQSQKIAIPVLIVVLLLVFRSPIAAAVPAVAGLAAVGASSGVIALGTSFYDLGALAVGVAAMMGLALGVDYSLLIVSRFREELAANPEVTPRDAAATAAATAGRTVLFAGLVLVAAMTVAVLLAPGPVLVSIVTGVVVAVLLSLVSAAIAVPPALALVGRRIDRWRIGRPSVNSPLLTSTARFAMGRPLVVATAVLLFLLALAVPALGLKTTPPIFTMLPEDHRARQDFEAIRDTLSAGQVTSFEIVLHSEDGPLTEPRRLLGIQRFQRTLARDPGVAGVVGPRPIASPVAAGGGSSSTAERHQAAMVVNTDRGGDTARVYVVPRYFAADDRNGELRERLMERADELAAASGLETAVGGLAAQYVEFQREAAAYIPTLVVALSLITFLLLVVILRAVVLPAVAVLLNIAIVAASFGALELLFGGDPPLLGGPGLLEVATAAAIFTVLFALSVDYEVFLLTRMHEAHATGRAPRDAVLHGIARTGSVVTGAALIMVAVFVAFSVSEFAIPRQFGTGLAIAVLLDALFLRLFLLPAAMRLLGERSWWLPSWLDRLLPRLDVEGAGRGSSAS